jgi:hypothetical protein
MMMILARLFGGFSGLLEALEFFAGFETHGFARRDVDFFTGAGVAADAGFARLDAKYSEAAQFNALAATESVLQGFEDGFHGLLGLGAANVRRRGVDHGVDDVQLDHASLQCVGLQMLEGTVQVVKTWQVIYTGLLFACERSPIARGNDATTRCAGSDAGVIDFVIEQLKQRKT